MVAAGRTGVGVRLLLRIALGGGDLPLLILGQVRMNLWRHLELARIGVICGLRRVLRQNRHRFRDHRSSLRFVITGVPVPAIPSWLLEPLWDQFAALLPVRPVYAPSHPLGCHRPRISDRIVFEKLIQVLRFGCSYESIADCSCGATTIRERRSEWIRAGIFAELKKIARESYDRIVGLVLEELAVDGCITKAPGGGECAGRSPVDRGKLGMKRSLLVEGNGIPLGRVLAPANRHDSPPLAATLDTLY